MDSSSSSNDEESVSEKIPLKPPNDKTKDHIVDFGPSINEKITAKSKKTDLNTKFLQAVLGNDERKLQDLFEKIEKQHFHARHKNHGNKTTVVIACINHAVTTNTLEKLFQLIKNKFQTVDLVDELWFGWEPIHYATEVGNPDKLKIVAEFTNVNALTYFSENALHILLESNKLTVYGNFYNDLVSVPCSVTNEISENVLQCAEILFEHSIDVNHTNFWGETPIFLALKFEYEKLVEKINELYPDINIDLSDMYEENLREFSKIKHILSGSLCHEPAATLFDYIKTGQDELFIRFMNGNIRGYVDEVDGGDDFNTSGTMLQLCFRKVFLEYIQCDKYHQKLDDDLCDIMDTPMLEVFRSSKTVRFMEHLLENGADQKKQTRKFGETLLEAAAVRGFYPLVAILLEHKRSNIGTEDILEILPKLFESKFKLANQDIYKKYALNLLLNKLISLQDATLLDSGKRQILNETLIKLNLNGNVARTDDSENIFLILRLGASLTYVGKNGKTVLEELDYDILKTHFEDCVDNDVLHYDSIVEDFGKLYSETKTLKLLLKDSKKSNLLTTPVLTVLIHEKWYRIIGLFYTNLAFYVFFVLSIYAYIIAGFSGKEYDYINYIFYVLLFFYCLKEVVQLLLYRWKYFLDFSNYLELVVVGLCLLCIFSPHPQYSTLVIFFSTVILFLFLVQVPKFTKFTFILGSLKYFFQYACFYFIPFVSFAIGLYILFPHPDATTRIPAQNSSGVENNATKHNGDVAAELLKHLFETLILFTGEFNDRVLQPAYYPVFGRIFMTIFILCMTIVLNNLLVGLIVSDMDRIEKESRIYKRIKMANFLILINSTAKQLRTFKMLSCIEKFLPRIHLFKKGYVKTIEIVESTKEHFDEENKKHLEELQKLKWTLYDDNVLKKVDDELHKDNKD